MHRISKVFLIMVVVFILFFAGFIRMFISVLSPDWSLKPDPHSMGLQKNRIAYFKDHEKEFNRLVELATTKDIKQVINTLDNDQDKKGPYTHISNYYVFPKIPDSDCAEIVTIMHRLNLRAIIKYGVTGRYGVDGSFSDQFRLNYNAPDTVSSGWTYFYTVPSNQDKQYHELNLIKDHWYTYDEIDN